MKTKKRKPKIFHGLVNYGTQSGHLSAALRDLGYDAISVTNIDLFNRKSDYSFKQQFGIFKKVLYYKFVYNFIKLKCFFKFDIFHFYFGETLFQNRIDLYFYRFFGKKVVMEYLGNDIRPHQFLIERYNLDANHPFAKKPKEHDNLIRKRIKLEIERVDYRLVCLPLYFAHAKYFNLPIDGILNLGVPLPDTVPYETPKDEFIIMHAPTSREFKGTKYYQDAINTLISKGYKIRFEILEKLDHFTLLEKIKDCHIFCDQISEGWYGTVSIEAMALGKPTCAFIDEEWLAYCDFSMELPVINTKPSNVAEVLKYYLDNPDLLKSKSNESVLFVKKYHDIHAVATEASKIYKQLWPH